METIGLTRKETLVNPTILIVDDNDVVRAALRDWLEAVFPQCNVVEGRSGEESIELVGKHKPDLVLMDVRLPGMNGIEAVREITDRLSGTPVVMLSILQDAEYRREAACAGAVGYISKDQMMRHLFPLIQSILLEKAENGREIAQLIREKGKGYAVAC